MDSTKRLKHIKESHDLIIVGGGIYGATLLWEATLNGLSAVLIEKDDFGSATSANSLKIIHGGLRYLQQLDLKRVRESSKELHILMRIAPHLVHPLPCIIPTYRQISRGNLAFRLAFRLNDLICFNSKSNAYLGKHIPPGELISVNELRERIPALELSGVTGGALWYDAQDYNSERLVLDFILSALELGADAFNYIKVNDLIVRKNRVIGVKAYDVLSSQGLELYGKVVVNATGPWINEFNELITGNQKKGKVHLAKAVNIIVPRLFSDCAFGLRATGGADDNVQYNRFLFFVPWRGATMIGTWYFLHDDTPDNMTLKSNEFEACLSEVQKVFPGGEVTGDEVCFLHIGTIPVERDSSTNKIRLRTHHSLIDYSRYGGPEGVISVLGVKYTTARNVAHKAIHLLSKKLGKRVNSSRVKLEKLVGGKIESFEGFLQEKKRNNDNSLTDSTIEHLVLNYGAKCEEILRLLSENRELGDIVPGSQEAVKAELLHSIKKEFAYNLSDLLLRRTDIGSLGKPSEATIRFCADFMANEMGWSGPEKHYQIKSLLMAYERLSNH